MTLAAIASSVGHGALGLRSRLLPMTDLLARSYGQKHAFIELRGSKVITGWSVVSGAIYQATMTETFEGRRLDVVSLRTTDEVFRRVQSQTEMAAGTYYFDSEVASLVYAWATDSSSLAATDVQGIFGFYLGTCNVVQPTLGASLLVDGGLESWTSSTNLTNWTEETIGTGGGNAPTQETSVVYAGSNSVRLDGTFNAAGGRGIMQTTTAAGGASSGITNKVYRLSGAYRTPADIPDGLAAAIQVQMGVYYATSDGRDWTTTDTKLSLTPTGGAWARFAFDYMVQSNGHHVVRAMAYSTRAVRSSAIYFDDLRLSRIYRFELHPPRVALDSVPRYQEGRTGIFFDRWTSGGGTLTLLNADGFLESLLGSFDWINQEVYIRIGGRFPDGGNEILPEDQLTRRWFVRRVDVTDDRAVFQLEAPRSIFRERIPPRNYNSQDFPDVATIDIGRPRPLVFAAGIPNVRPAGVALDATTGYRSYELYDPQYMLRTDVFGTRVHFTYVTEEDADKGVGNFLQTISFSTDVPNAQIEPASDVQIVKIEAGINDLIDFDEGGAALVATVAPGLYVPEYSLSAALSAAVKAALDAAGGTYTVDYSDTTHKWTITKDGGGTLNLRLTSAAPNRDRSIMPTLGFTGRVDLTGATTYTGDTAVFTDPDVQHIVRVTTAGYLDDGAGTYTGTAGSVTIHRPGDVMYFLLRQVLGVDPNLIDTASLAACRTGTGDKPMYVYIGGLQSGGAASDTAHEFGQVVEWLENSSGVELLLDGPTFVFRIRDNSTPANVVDLYDRDFLSFDSWLDYDDMASTVRLESYQNPSTGQVGTVETSTNMAMLRLGRPVTKVVTTYFATLADAQDMLDQWVANTINPRRRFRFRVKGRLLKKIVGDKVRINRTKFMGRTDAAPSVVARIIHKVDDLQTWESEIDAAEVLAVTDGW